MHQKFQASITPRDDLTYVRVGGVIDEDNELAQLAERIAPTTVVVDVAEVERINSCGVRDWVNWLARLDEKGARVVLVECSPAVVAQINLVHNFVGRGAVRNFYAPYFCPSCNLERVLLVELEEVRSQDQARAPICRCDECDGVMEFDDLEDSYFAFVPSVPVVKLTAPERAAIADISAEEPTGERKVRTPASAAGSGSLAGITGRGSSPSTVTLPSLPTVPSLPALGGSSFGEATPPEVFTLPTPPPAESANSNKGTNLWLLAVTGLLLLAIGLLVYVIATRP